MKYTTVREFYKYNYEHGETDMTFKEWDSLDKAIAYAHRYAKGLRFVGVTVEDENGNVLYEILNHGADTFDYRDKKEVEEATKKEITKLINSDKKISVIDLVKGYSYEADGDAVRVTDTYTDDEFTISRKDLKEEIEAFKFENVRVTVLENSVEISHLKSERAVESNKKKLLDRIEELREGVTRLGAYASEANYMGMFDEEQGAMDLQSKYMDEIENLKEQLKEMGE